MCSTESAQFLTERVAPFGNPRLGLLDSSPGLFAVLPRPSSALDAKASTMCPSCLTCFRFDISLSSLCNIQLLKCGRQKKRSGGFATRPCVWLFATSISCLCLCLHHRKSKSSTGQYLCQHYFKANIPVTYGNPESFFNTIFFGGIPPLLEIPLCLPFPKGDD